MKELRENEDATIALDKIDIKELPVEVQIKTATVKEKERLIALLLKEMPFAVQTYKALIKSTGGLLTSSVGYAYERGIRDALKIITKENKT